MSNEIVSVVHNGREYEAELDVGDNVRITRDGRHVTTGTFADGIIHDTAGVDEAVLELLEAEFAAEAPA